MNMESRARSASDLSLYNGKTIIMLLLNNSFTRADLLVGFNM